MNRGPFDLNPFFVDKGALCGQATTTGHLIRTNLIIVMGQEKIVKLTI